jgi:hypothetical protein
MPRWLLKFIKLLASTQSTFASLFEKYEGKIHSIYIYAKNNAFKSVGASITLLASTLVVSVFFGLIPLDFDEPRLSISSWTINKKPIHNPSTSPDSFQVAFEFEMDVLNWGVFDHGAISDAKVDTKSVSKRYEGRVIYIDRAPVDNLSNEKRRFIFVSKLPCGIPFYEWDITLYDSEGEPIGSDNFGLKIMRNSIVNSQDCE